MLNETSVKTRWSFVDLHIKLEEFSLCEKKRPNVSCDFHVYSVVVNDTNTSHCKTQTVLRKIKRNEKTLHTSCLRMLAHMLVPMRSLRLALTVGLLLQPMTSLGSPIDRIRLEMS